VGIQAIAPNARITSTVKGGRPRTVNTPDPEPEPKPNSPNTSAPPWELNAVPVAPPQKRLETKKKSEAFYRDRICKKWNGTPEYTLDDGARVDCLTDQYAVEFDFSNKWAEAVGQSLYYSMKTGKKAGIVLIMNGNSSQRHLERLKEVIGHYRLDIKIWTLKTQQAVSR